MTCQEFNQLPYILQMTRPYMRGRYLATRWQETNEAVRLYLMPEGYFVESTYNTGLHKVLYLFAFEAGNEDDRLEDYAMFVKLPDWMG
jgi:hypothetical protein